jgi:hypothetical protein
VNGKIGPRLILPSQAVDTVVRLAHSSLLSGHMGSNRTYEQLKDRVYRPGLKKAVEDFVKCCHVCQVNKTSGQAPRESLQSIRTFAPFELITTDIVGPLPRTEEGFGYIIVVCDHFTKWAQAYPLRSLTALEAAERLVEFILRFGIPACILSDQGRNYESELIASVCELLDISKLRTSPYHPEANGLSERFNKTLKTILRCYINDEHSNWDKLLAPICFAYNTSVHASTKHTPFELVFGRKPKIPLDLILGEKLRLNNQADIVVRGENDDSNMFADESDEDNIDYRPAILNDYVKQLQSYLNRAYEEVIKSCDVAVARQALYYDRKICPYSYAVGEQVLMLNKAGKIGRSKKLSQLWKGPFVVDRKLSKLLYEVHRLGGKRKIVVHHNNLKRYFSTNEVQHEPTQETAITTNEEPHQASEMDPHSPVMVEPNVRKRGRPRKNTNNGNRDNNEPAAGNRRGTRVRRQPDRLDYDR